MWGKERSKLGPSKDKRDGTEVGMHGDVSGAVSRDDDILGEPNGETGGDDGVGWMGQVIYIYPYVSLNTHVKSHIIITLNTTPFMLYSIA
jgi:hypothetical protein